jgi:hypothetical protein
MTMNLTTAVAPKISSARIVEWKIELVVCNRFKLGALSMVNLLLMNNQRALFKVGLDQSIYVVDMACG